MMDIGWLVFLGLVAAGSLGTAMAISGRYEAVVFAITAGFFFTFLSLVVMVETEWGVMQEVNHDYQYIVASSNYVQIEHLDFSDESVLNGWTIGTCPYCMPGLAIKYRAADEDIRFTTEALSSPGNQTRAQLYKTITVDGTITKISGTLEVFGKMRDNESRWSITAESINWNTDYTYWSTVYKNKVNWEIDIGAQNQSSKAELIFLRTAGSGTDSVAKTVLFDIESITIEYKPSPPAQIDSITESHGTVWLRPMPQIQMFLATFLGLIGLWAFFYSITCMFQFGPGRAKK